MCHFETSWKDDRLKFPELNECIERLQEMQKDGLVEFTENGIKITEKARPFVRNICMTFDLRLIRNKTTTRIFSMTI